MRESIRRALLIVAAVFCLAVIAVPDWCSYAPAWLRPYIGCPECTGGEAEQQASGGGCSGASSFEPGRPRLHASAGRRMFEVVRVIGALLVIFGVALFAWTCLMAWVYWWFQSPGYALLFLGTVTWVVSGISLGKAFEQDSDRRRAMWVCFAVVVLVVFGIFAWCAPESGVTGPLVHR